jgi:hypothetical protein
MPLTKNNKENNMNEIIIKTPDSLNDGETMTSLEIVDFINATRQPGEGLLRHDNFMQKVPKVLSENYWQFEGMATWIANGGVRQRPIYNFPRHQAYLMAMSYSYKLQEMVYDAMVAAQSRSAAAEAAQLTGPAATTEPWPSNYAQSLRLLAQQVEAKEMACKQAAVMLCNE